MLIAITTIAHDYSLLPYYLEHYRNLGVERFYIAVVENILAKFSGEEMRTRLEREKDVFHIFFPSEEGRDVWRINGAATEFMRRQFIKKEDYFIPADLDELNIYPGTENNDLKSLTSLMEKEGFTHVRGELKDKFCTDGSLAELKKYDECIPLWQQYPVEYPATRDIMKGLTSKIILARGDMPLATGHHMLSDEKPALVKEFPFQGEAHHFKWRKGLLVMLAKRIEDESRQDVPWVAESRRLYDYFLAHGNKLNLS